MRAKHFCVLTTRESMVKIWHHINALLSKKVSAAAVCFNAVVLLLLIHCVLLLPLFVGSLVFGQCLVMLYLVYNLVFLVSLKVIVGSYNFSAQFIEIFSIKKICYNLNELQQTACLVVKPITVGNFPL